MERTEFFRQRFAQPVQINLIGFFGKEAGAAVMASLHDVQGNYVKMNARATRHEAS
jgi:hypothetical protein